MAKFFQFGTRNVEIRFFDADPITVRLTISDETDLRFAKGAELLRRGTESGDIEERKRLWTEAVEALIGTENCQSILARSPEKDSFALAELYRWIVDAYAGAKVKNLSASAR